MIFKSYHKIEEDFKRFNLSVEDNRLLNKIDWVVTEKIHGANFSVITNGNYIRYTKRKELLEDQDDFFGYKQPLQKLELNFLALYEQIQKDFPQVTQISIYGELFGGGYPHAAISPNSEVSLVQSGIYYSPHIEFMVFDIFLIQPEKELFLNYHTVIKYCQQFGIAYCLPLHIGKLAEALNFNYDFQSTIPKILGLPQLEIPNKAEGIVIKPVEDIWITTDKGPIRPIIKRKIKEFSEEMYTQSYQEGDIKQKVLSLINKNRLNNAISKIGKVAKNDKTSLIKINQYLLEDIEEEIKNIESQTHKKLPAKQKEVLMAEVKKAIQEFLRSL